MTELPVAILMATLLFVIWLLVLDRAPEPTECGVRCFPARRRSAPPRAL